MGEGCSAPWNTKIEYKILNGNPEAKIRLRRPRSGTVFVGPCHHVMARHQVADGGTASVMEGSCEEIE